MSETRDNWARAKIRDLIQLATPTRMATVDRLGLVLADTGWLDVSAYGTNYSAYDPVAFRPKYRRLSNGLVLFQGLIKKSVALVGAETMFTMPAGFRPGSTNGTLNAIGNAVGYMEVRCYSTGLINTGTILGGAGGNSYVNLDSLFYLAEN